MLIRLEKLRWVNEYDEDPPFAPNKNKVDGTTPIFVNPDHIAAIQEADPRFNRGLPEHCMVKVHVGGVGYDYQIAGKVEDIARHCGYSEAL